MRHCAARPSSKTNGVSPTVFTQSSGHGQRGQRAAIFMHFIVAFPSQFAAWRSALTFWHLGPHFALNASGSPAESLLNFSWARRAFFWSFFPACFSLVFWLELPVFGSARGDETVAPANVTTARAAMATVLIMVCCFHLVSRGRTALVYDTECQKYLSFVVLGETSAA